MKSTHFQGDACNAIEVVENLSNIVAKINQSVKDVSNYVSHKKANEAARIASKASLNEAYIRKASNDTFRVACALKEIASCFKV